MPTVQWIINEMEAWTPASLAESYDNVGLLVGDSSQPVKKILVALDATDAVIKEAIENNYDCIVTHHPLIRDPLKRIVASDVTARRVMNLIKNGISLYTAHTNLDKTAGGVGDCLAQKLGLGLRNVTPLIKDPSNEKIGFGRVGELQNEMTLGELAEHVKKSLGIKDVRYSGSLSTKIKKVALCGGSGMSFWQAVKDTNCDVYITGDVKYADANMVLSAGVSLLDITHYYSENVVVEAIVERLREKAKNANLPLKINATSVIGQTFYTV